MNGSLRDGPYAPAHYLRRFLPASSSVDAANAEAKAAGYSNWAEHFRVKSDWRLNKDAPTIAAWKMVQPITGQVWLLERNAYYYVVDTDGNQLPYIDKVQLTLAENPEVINLRAIAGEYDSQARHIDISKLPKLAKPSPSGRYK